MKFRTQLYILLVALTFGITLIGLGNIHWQAQRILFEELRSKVLSVAATAAHGVNGDRRYMLTPTLIRPNLTH